MSETRRALLVSSHTRSLAERISRQISLDAELVRGIPGDALAMTRWTANECELAAEVMRLNAENAGLRKAIEALRRDEDLARDLGAKADAVRAECARIAEARGLRELAVELRGRA